MKLPEELVTELVKVTNNNPSNTTDNTVYGTVVDNGDRLYVQLDGADEGVLTPIVTTATIRAGDRVVVSIRNHSAVVTGNAKDPSASSSEVAHALVRINSIDEDIDGIGIKLNDMTGDIEGIALKVDQNGIEIDAMGTRMDGLVTFESLTDGSTTIDGSCIKTGTIDAERLNMSGAITWDDLSSDMQTNIDSIESTASSAKNTASNALKTVSGFTIEDGQETYIDGSMIYSDSIYADSIHLGGKLSVYTEWNGDTVGGYLGYDNGFSSTEGIGIRNDDNTGQVVCTDEAARLSYGSDNQVVTSSEGIYYIANVGSMHWKFNDEYIAYMEDTYFGPYKGIVMDLGHTNAPWDIVYANTCEGTTSDRNKKNSIENLPEKYVTMFDSLIPRRFKMNNGTSNRYHVGYIAQEVEEAMNTAGIDSQEFGGFIRDKDDENNDIFLLRYGEFDAIYAAKIKQLEARIDELEKRLNAVEGVS